MRLEGWYRLIVWVELAHFNNKSILQTIRLPSIGTPTYKQKCTRFLFFFSSQFVQHYFAYLPHQEYYIYYIY